jgi:hypothetical protein
MIPSGPRLLRRSVVTDRLRVLMAMVEDGLLPEPTELEKRRFARLSVAEMFGVGVWLEAGKRAGETPTLSEAIREAQEVVERNRARRKSSRNGRS